MAHQKRKETSLYETWRKLHDVIIVLWECLRIEFECHNTSVAHYGNYCYRFYSLLLFLPGRQLPRGFHSGVPAVPKVPRLLFPVSSLSSSSGTSALSRPRFTRTFIVIDANPSSSLSRISYFLRKFIYHTNICIREKIPERRVRYLADFKMISDARCETADATEILLITLLVGVLRMTRL